MFEENENLVTDVTENVDDLPTEELVDGAKETEPVTEEPIAETFTREQVDEMIAKKLARKEAKIRKEYDKRYGRLENVLKAGTGVENVEEMADTFTDFYTEQFKKKGLKFEPDNLSQFSQRDIEYLAEGDAKDIIASGYDEVVEELNRLSAMELDDMTAREKHLFLKLKQEADRVSNEKELKSIGITELPDGFDEYAKKLNPSLSLKEKYEMYSLAYPKKKVEPMGSMKNTDANTNKGVKDYYSPEEASKFTRKDFEENPELYKAICDSMPKWKK